MTQAKIISSQKADEYLVVVVKNFILKNSMVLLIGALLGGAVGYYLFLNHKQIYIVQSSTVAYINPGNVFEIIQAHQDLFGDDKFQEQFSSSVVAHIGNKNASTLEALLVATKLSDQPPTTDPKLSLQRYLKKWGGNFIETQFSIDARKDLMLLMSSSCCYEIVASGVQQQAALEIASAIFQSLAKLSQDFLKPIVERRYKVILANTQREAAEQAARLGKALQKYDFHQKEMEKEQFDSGMNATLRKNFLEIKMRPFREELREREDDYRYQNELIQKLESSKDLWMFMPKHFDEKTASLANNTIVGTNGERTSNFYWYMSTYTILGVLNFALFRFVYHTLWPLSKKHLFRVI